MTMIDHVSVRVSDYQRSKAFFEKALAPLGYTMVMELDMPEGKVGGMGVGGAMPDFWISQGEAQRPPVHIAFNADDRASVDAFHQAAGAAGGRDNGKPGLRPHYHQDYYGAFILDPDGNNIEAVCHKPQ
jgi:catechol 2,3-dioxygenase-like lactoylglutathione lyase family enzyme